MSEPDLSRRGPHPVGVLQTGIPSFDDPLDPARCLPCEIWYPAASDASEAKPAAHPLGLPHRAKPGLPPLTEPRPLIGFSHGNSGLRQQSTFLTTHLASWGFVVVAPDHVGNTFPEMAAIEGEAERREVHLRARTQRPHDLLQAMTALIDRGHAEQGRPPIDPASIGVLGHSYGGWTALKAPAREPRIRAVCGLAPASEPFVGRRAFEPGELPLPARVRSLVVAAQDDILVDLETSIRPLHARLGPESELAILDRADHFHFCDGIALLHALHERTPRPRAPRPPRPLAELRNEADTHAWLQERVTRFFRDTLGAKRES
jgi:predicted dienelactone hydrolase